MNKAIVTTFLASAMLVGTAFAHDGVENPAVGGKNHCRFSVGHHLRALGVRINENN